MAESYYRTGQAAAELGISSHAVRQLCQHGLIDAEYSGKQWRVPVAEVQRLKRDGVPPVPTSGDGATPASRGNSNRTSASALLAPPSEAAAESAEDALISRNRLEATRAKVDRLELKKKATEIGDFFRGRQEAERRRRAEEEAVAEEQHRSELRARKRQAFVAEWIEYVLNRAPSNAPEECRLDVHSEVTAALERLDPDTNKAIVESLVDAAVDRALAPWRASTARQKIVDEAHMYLPVWARFDEKWRTRAQEAASAAVSRMPSEALFGHLEIAVKAAVQPIAAEYEHNEKLEKAVKWINLDGATSKERDDAKETILEELRSLPGASERQIEQTKKAVLQRIQGQVSERRNREAEQQRAREHEAAVSAVLSAAEWSLGSIPVVVKREALAEIAEAIAELPEVSSKWDMEKVRDPIVTRYRNKEALIAAGLGEIYSYLSKLEKDYEFDKTAYTLDSELKPPIEKALREELHGKETREQVAGIVRRLVREELELD